jgi:basic membrane protein A and related proteins
LIGGILIGLVFGASIVWVTMPVYPLPAYKIAIVFAVGGLDDKSFNDLAFIGAERAQEELGINIEYAHTNHIEQFEGIQVDFAKSGQYTLIVCIGSEQVEALNKTAKAYPNQSFALIEGEVNQPNVACVMFRANEGAFLTGIVAGMMSKTQKVSFVGGMDVPPIRDFYVGFEAGVAWANPNVSVLNPVYVGEWANPTKAKELALSQIELGADGVFACAGKSGLGALQATHEHEILGFGVDSCQDYLYPKIVASATKRVDLAVYKLIKAAVISKIFPNLNSANGGFEPGIRSVGLTEGWVGCSRLPNEENFWEITFNFKQTRLPTNVVNKLTQARNEIIAGTIIVPSEYT